MLKLEMELSQNLVLVHSNSKEVIQLASEIGNKNDSPIRLEMKMLEFSLPQI